MTIEVILSPLLYPQRQLKDNDAVVAVDILRATTSICAAFQAGAVEVVPLDSLDPLALYAQKGYRVAAERGGEKVVVAGVAATCGNSPTEYLTMDLSGEKLAYSTTNGTVSILLAKDCRRVYAGSFANLSALARRIKADGIGRLVILCSGWKGDPCIEDTLFAGALCGALQEESINDAAIYAQDLYALAKGKGMYEFCLRATHVHRLQRLNYDHDIRFAFEEDTCPVVPVMTDGVSMHPAD